MLIACRKTAVTARRIALQMIHNIIVTAPDRLREQLRVMIRIQLVRALAAWRPDLTACRVGRVATGSASSPLAVLSRTARQTADLDAMIAAIVEDLRRNPERDREQDPDIPRHWPPARSPR